MNSSSLNKIAKKYAKALLLLADENATRLNVELGNELKIIKEVFNSNENLRNFLFQPNTNKKNKKETLCKIFKNSINDLTLNLLLVLLDKGRVRVAPLLAEAYQEALCEKNNVAVAVINTANQLEESKLNHIKQDLERVFNKHVEIQTNIDKSLIAGIKINVGDKVIDSSVKFQLQSIKKHLQSL